MTDVSRELHYYEYNEKDKTITLFNVEHGPQMVVPLLKFNDVLSFTIEIADNPKYLTEIVC